MAKISSYDEFMSLVEQGGSEVYYIEADVDVWEGIIKKAEAKTRNTVAMNKTIQEPIIRELAQDKNRSVRRAIARKRATPADVLAQLANDSLEDIRREVAINKKVPREILISLLHDDCESVRRRAEKRLRKVDE